VVVYGWNCTCSCQKELETNFVLQNVAIIESFFATNSSKIPCNQLHGKKRLWLWAKIFSLLVQTLQYKYSLTTLGLINRNNTSLVKIKNLIELKSDYWNKSITISSFAYARTK